MRGVDFSSWQSLLATFIGLAIFALVSVGIRLTFMLIIQQKRERANRQINERLKVLISAYKILGGSFTGELMVDPRHFRDVSNDSPSLSLPNESQPLLRERTRRIRDAVEGALADILLLGTKEHVRLAEDMVRHLLEGKVVYTHELVMSLRTFIRQALDLESIPTDIHTPLQGPTRVVNYQKNKDTNKKQNNYEKDEKIKKTNAMGTGNTSVLPSTEHPEQDSR